MVLSSLTKVHKGTMQSFSISSKTPAEVQKDHDLNTRWYIEVYSKNENKYTTLDLSLIFTETNLNKCITWEDFASKLTDAIIIPYTAILSKSHNCNLIVTHLLNNEEFELSYCNLNVPEDRNIRQFRWRMPDLVVSKINSKNTTNFNNCICSVNGIISRPVVHNGELFIKDGARYMSSTTLMRHPSLLLMDFSELGDITIVPFKDCKYSYYKPKNEEVNTCDVKLFLPDGIDLTNKTVFPVIAHSLFFPTDVTISSTSSVVLSPYKLPIRASLFKCMNHKDEYIKNTDIIKMNKSINDYISSDMFVYDKTDREIEEADCEGNFLIIVDNPHVFITKQHASQFASSTHTLLEANGVLFDQSTQSFIDYVKVDYDSLTDIYLNVEEDIFECDIPYDRVGYGFNTWNCVHNEPLFNINKRDLYVLNFFGDKQVV